MLSGCDSVIPHPFLSFQGYCFPVHREYALTNLSCDQLVSHTAALYDALLLAILDGYKCMERNVSGPGQVI